MSRHLILCVLAFSLLAGSEAHAAGLDAHWAVTMPPPQNDMKSHTVGNLKLVVTNWGFFGNAGDYEQIPWSLEFPAESDQDYLFAGALWIGAVVGGDTLVSVGANGWAIENEFCPGSAPEDRIEERSNDTLSPHYHPDAVSEQDLISAFTDTVGPPYAPPDHVPLEISVTQHSYCWSSDWVKDFVLVRLQIENIRKDELTLQDLYTAIYLDGDVVPVTDDGTCRHQAAQDDITGFRRWRHESDSLWLPGTVLYVWNGSGYESVDIGGTPKYNSPCDQPGIAWIADDDGVHPDIYCPPVGRAQCVAGVRAISLAQERMSYHWWFSDSDDSLDWGPSDSTDSCGPGGTPMGDSAKYALMSCGKIDPDQVCKGLEYPPGIDSISDTRYMISFGPHDLPFGETLEVVWAFVGGERFHNGHGWCEWDFADLIMNGNRAYAVYDNPGIDTDGDGYFGDYVVVDGDTLYLTGDGVPDYEECENPPWNPCDMIVGVEDVSGERPGVAFELWQNCPNPFSGSTRVSFAVSSRTHVDLSVFDVCGRLVATIANEQLKPGRYSYDWRGKSYEGRELGAGVYFYRLSAGGLTQTRKLVVVR